MESVERSSPVVRALIIPALRPLKSRNTSSTDLGLYGASIKEQKRERGRGGGRRRGEGRVGFARSREGKAPGRYKNIVFIAIIIYL